MYMENRFKMLVPSKPEDARRLLHEAQQDVNTRRQLYEYLAADHASSVADTQRGAVGG